MRPDIKVIGVEEIPCERPNCSIAYRITPLSSPILALLLPVAMNRFL